jgi:hypothetical protein
MAALSLVLFVNARLSSVGNIGGAGINANGPVMLAAGGTATGNGQDRAHRPDRNRKSG